MYSPYNSPDTENNGKSTIDHLEAIAQDPLAQATEENGPMAARLAQDRRKATKIREDLQREDAEQSLMLQLTSLSGKEVTVETGEKITPLSKINTISQISDEFIRQIYLSIQRLYFEINGRRIGMNFNHAYRTMKIGPITIQLPNSKATSIEELREELKNPLEMTWENGTHPALSLEKAWNNGTIDPNSDIGAIAQALIRWKLPLGMYQFILPTMREVGWKF